MKSGFLSVLAAFWLAAGSAPAAIRIAAVSSEPYPAAVGADGRANAVYTAEMMLDGNLETFACLLDDTRTGNDRDTRPPNGSLPVTGLLVFDLGAVRHVSGLELVSRREGTCYLPREVDVVAVDAESVTPGMLAGANGDPRFRTVLSRHQVPACVVSGKGHVILFAEKDRPLLPERPEGGSAHDGTVPVLSAIETRFLGLRVRSSHTPVEGRHYNYQIAEVRVLVLDGEGRRVVLTGQGQQPLETLPALAADVSRAEAERQGEDALAAAERRYLEQGLNATHPYPEARLHKDWIYQDHGLDYQACFADTRAADRERRMVERVLGELQPDDENASPLRTEFADLVDGGVVGADARWRALYLRACQLRRQTRLAALRTHTDRIVFTKHYFLSGVVHYAWTDHITDQQYSERNVDYRMGASLHVLTIGEDGEVQMETLLETPTGIIRDPNVSYDGTKIVFSMRHNDTDDDYHLYVMEVATRTVQQITFGLGASDIEPCFLPDGDIVFVSSRCIQLTDCWRQSVSNLYTCDGQGRFLRRLGYDQVHTNYPQTLDDGRVIYTRWEYNDRGQIFPQPLFVMNGDGTGQAEFYGGNSWFPTSILHARGIPGTQKVIGIASGHHTTQRGKLILVDRSRGTQEAVGIEYLAPRKPAEAVRVDRFGWEGEQFQYPYAFDQQNYLLTYCPEGSPNSQNGPFPVPYAVYFMTEDGRRELLAYDPAIHCNQSVPLAARPVPPQRASQVDYTQTLGTYYVQDVHVGQGVTGVPRGTVKSLRVVALEYRAADAYYNSNVGEAGRSHSRTPPSINNGSWDVKHVLGTVPVEADGSAYFEVPARTPVYFQLLDDRGYVVQTMRSWSTLQPGEMQTCIGCHEAKHEAPPPMPSPAAMRTGPLKLTPFDPFAAQHGARNPITDTSLTGREAVKALLTVNHPGGLDEPRGFSYVREIQPILDKHCVRCHTGGKTEDGRDAPFSLEGHVLPYSYTQCPNNGDKTQDARRAFTASYLNLTRFGHGDGPVNWINAQTRPTRLPPYAAGAATSKLMQHLEPSHNEVLVSPAEKLRVACWIDLCVPFCGSYTDANQWEPQVLATYLYFEAKRARLAEIEIDNLRKLVAARTQGKTFAPEDFQVFDQGGPEARRRFEQAWLEVNPASAILKDVQPGDSTPTNPRANPGFLGKP